LQRVSSRAGLPGRAARQQSPLIQFSVLCRRYLAAIAADRPYLISLIVLPVVPSLLARAVPGSDGLSTAAGGKQPAQLLLVLIMGGALMGSAAAVRELVKERAIYRRERASGLSLGAYLSSKVAVLGVLTGIQAGRPPTSGAHCRPPRAIARPLFVSHKCDIIDSRRLGSAPLLQNPSTYCRAHYGE
jgi:hypothetical protein